MKVGIRKKKERFDPIRLKISLENERERTALMYLTAANVRIPNIVFKDAYQANDIDPTELSHIITHLLNKIRLSIK